MKRIISVFFALAALAGCVREIQNDESEMSAVILKACVLNDRSKVGASIDKEAGVVDFFWQGGDKVAVKTSAGFEPMTIVGDGGSSEAEFRGMLQGILGGVAVYPSSSPMDLSGETLTVSLADQYEYQSGQTHALMYARILGEWMRFTHLGALLKIDVEGVPAGASLVVTTPGRRINGEFSSDLSVQNPVVSAKDAQNISQSTVTVKFAQSESLAEVYVPIPVGEYPSIEVKVLDNDGRLIEGSLRETTTAKKFSRAGVKSMPKIVMKLPILELASRAYNMEKVTLAYGNIPDGQKVTLDFGDGTSSVTLSGSGSYVHQFDNPTGSDKTCTVTLTTDGQTVQKNIYVYSLMALTEVARRFKDPSCTDVWVMAHRANTSNKSIPENSISAVKASIAAGANVVETDTRLTSDGEIVICHDESVSRTTNGSGNISDLTFSKIRTFRLKDRNGRVTSEVMPTLREFLEAARGKIYVNLDYSPRTASTAQVMAVVEEMGMYEQVLFYCNSAAKVAEVGAINPNAHAYAWFSQHAALKQLPGEHFMQCSYTPDSPTNISAALSNGLICTVNMLTDVPSTYIDTDKLQQLFSYYPSTRIIQIDAADKLVEVLRGGIVASEPRDYFVTPTGSGDKSGSSWENAMDMVRWRAFVGTSEALKTYGDCAEIDKATFHFLEGTYCIPDADHGILRMEYTDYGKMLTLTILGGYESTSRGTDISKRNPAANLTEFTGDLNGNGVADTGDAGIFCLDAFAHLKIDGVTFAHSYGRSRWDQKAFIVNTPVSGAQARVDFTGCRFHDLYGFKDSDSKYHGGAAVWVGKNAIATLSKCELYDCHSYSRGGALRIAEGTGIIFLNDCAVHDNVVTDRFGSAVHVTSGSILANNCTMAHNDGHFGVLNGSGNWLLVNSTIVADYISSTSGSNMTWRSESGSDRTAAILNSIMLFDGYTSVLVNGASYNLTSLGYNMTGTNGEYFSPHSYDVTGCTTASLGISWNTDGYYQWGGPASGFTKSTLAAVEQAVRSGCNRTAGPFSNIGLEFYNWLQSLQTGRNPLAFDQAGNPRNTSAMWPGAYEKH